VEDLLNLSLFILGIKSNYIFFLSTIAEIKSCYVAQADLDFTISKCCKSQMLELQAFAITPSLYFLFFGGTGGTQALMLARQVLYHLSHFISSFFVLGTFEIGS
jgi:hypothetical protein